MRRAGQRSGKGWAARAARPFLCFDDQIEVRIVRGFSKIFFSQSSIGEIGRKGAHTPFNLPARCQVYPIAPGPAPAPGTDLPLGLSAEKIILRLVMLNKALTGSIAFERSRSPGINTASEPSALRAGTRHGADAWLVCESCERFHKMDYASGQPAPRKCPAIAGF